MIGLHNNEQVDTRELFALGAIRDDALTVVRLHAIEPGYCIDAPDVLPAGSCLGFTPRTKSGAPAKRPGRNLSMWNRSWR